MEDILNKDLFCSHLIMVNRVSYFYEKPLNASHLKPIEEFLLEGKELTGFSQELISYMEARRCVLDFDIYTLKDNYQKFPNVVALLMECYFQAASEGVMEAYNNIGVFYGMIDRDDEAIPYFERAAEAGLVSGMINLMGYYGYKEDYDKQFYYVERLAEIRHPAGMYNYALCYHFGYMGREIDIEKARGMYENMMTLYIEDDNKALEFTESILLKLKTWACYNLARLRLLTEDHNENNLKDIISLLTETPCIYLSEAQNEELVKEIKQLMKR